MAFAAVIAGKGGQMLTHVQREGGRWRVSDKQNTYSVPIKRRPPGRLSLFTDDACMLPPAACSLRSEGKGVGDISWRSPFKKDRLAAGTILEILSNRSHYNSGFAARDATCWLARHEDTR